MADLRNAATTAGNLADKVFDNRYTRWGGGLTFVYGAIRVGQSVVGGDPGTALTILLLAAGVLLLAAPYAGKLIKPKPVPKPKPKPKEVARRAPRQPTAQPGGIFSDLIPSRPRRPFQPTTEKLAAARLVHTRNRIEEELVLIIDECKLFSGKADQRASYSVWRDRTANFLEVAFGVADRQRFLEAASSPIPALAPLGALQWLRAKRDSPKDWRVRVTLDPLQEAIKERRGEGQS